MANDEYDVSDSSIAHYLCQAFYVTNLGILDSFSSRVMLPLSPRSRRKFHVFGIILPSTDPITNLRRPFE
jgi:hypothetical protein